MVRACDENALKIFREKHTYIFEYLSGADVDDRFNSGKFKTSPIIALMTPGAEQNITIELAVCRFDCDTPTTRLALGIAVIDHN
jgi:hypothetical protein